MRKRPSKRKDKHDAGHKLAEDFRSLSNRILLYANRGLPRIDFMREVSKMLLDFWGCDAVELRLNRRNKCYRSEITRRPKTPFYFGIMPCTQDEKGRIIPCSQDNSVSERICQDIVLKHFDPSLPFFTKNGSFFTNNVKDFITWWSKKHKPSAVQGFSFEADYSSLAMISFMLLFNVGAF